MGFVQLVKELAEVWRIERDRRRKQKEQYRIEYAFTSGGRKYYCYEDITNLPYQRGRAALTCFNEIEMRCTREFLLKYTEAMDDVLQSNKIDIYKINSLNGLLKDRLNLTADLELCYRLAAIVFFDDTEKPEVYEPEYAAKKIERWRKDMKVSDFFMQKPLKELMPFLNNAVGDFDAFFLLNEELNKIHSDLTRITGSIKDKTLTMNGKK
jgi:hypothetical protein